MTNVSCLSRPDPNLLPPAPALTAYAGSGNATGASTACVSRSPTSNAFSVFARPSSTQVSSSSFVCARRDLR
jgi:hypothetical protein